MMVPTTVPVVELCAAPFGARTTVVTKIEAAASHVTDVFLRIIERSFNVFLTNAEMGR
jgi:hypothetical protein